MRRLRELVSRRARLAGSVHRRAAPLRVQSRLPRAGARRREGGAPRAVARPALPAGRFPAHAADAGCPGDDADAASARASSRCERALARGRGASACAPRARRVQPEGRHGEDDDVGARRRGSRARRASKVLLVDTDGQGNVAASLGLTPERTLYHVIVMGLPYREAVVERAPGARRARLERDARGRRALPGRAEAARSRAGAAPRGARRTTTTSSSSTARRAFRS